MTTPAPPNHPPWGAENPILRGIAFIILASLMLTLMDAMVKLLSTRIDTIQSLWARYTVQMVAVTALVAPRLRQVMRTDYLGLHILRATALLVTTLFFFFGLQVNSLTLTTAMFQVAPIFLMVGAAVFLGERFGIRRALAGAAAMVGAVIILRPGTDAFSIYALLPLAGAVTYTIYALTTRFVGPHEAVWTSLFYTATLATLTLSAAVPFFWQPLDRVDVALMLAMGGFGTLGQLFLIKAFSTTEASILAPFIYVSLLFSTLWDVVLFGILPDATTYLGALVIIGSGLYVWHRERVVKA